MNRDERLALADRIEGDLWRSRLSNGDVTAVLAALRQSERGAPHSQAGSNEPAAWLVKWRGGGSAYFTEDEARRAAENVNTYADYRPAEVVPVYYASSPPKSNDLRAKIERAIELSKNEIGAGEGWGAWDRMESALAQRVINNIEAALVSREEQHG